MVQEPPRSKGTMPALKGLPVWLATSTDALPGSPGGSLSVNANMLALRVAVRVKEGDTMLSESWSMVTVVWIGALPISVVVRFQVPTRLPEPGPVDVPVDASGLPELLFVQLPERVPRRPHTKTARFLIFKLRPVVSGRRPPAQRPPRPASETVCSRRRTGQGRRRVRLLPTSMKGPTCRVDEAQLSAFLIWYPMRGKCTCTVPARESLRSMATSSSVRPTSVPETASVA